MNRTPRLRALAATAAASVFCFGLTNPVAAATEAERLAYQTSKATNTERSDKNKTKLHVNKCLNAAAQAQAKRMAEAKRFVPPAWMSIATKCNFDSLGQNVGQDYPSGWRVVDDWMRSRSNRNNILGNDYKHVGAGAYRDADGIWWYSELFGGR